MSEHYQLCEKWHLSPASDSTLTSYAAIFTRRLSYGELKLDIF